MKVNIQYRLDGNKVWTYEAFKHAYYDSLPDGGFDLLWEKLPIVEVAYDSDADTLMHIKRVNEYLIEASQELLTRAVFHDQSKLEATEKLLFDEMTPKLQKSSYGTDEYKAMLKDLKVALDHHYAHNSHHPEHYTNGIDGMNLFDVLEMLLDWKASSERHNDGDIYKSIEINKTRFNMSPQLVNIYVNTAKYLQWLK
jgi:hypothetical protein